ncbi:hypothetical protein ACG02S_21325 [Roseateles sp. DC23W]|uniref:Uncharacterized protein n=1 Tax=Pelomonas dachongensis TaxID=3299029 RepID=A0ABW7ESN8_9BURK
MNHRWLARLAVVALHLALLAALWMHRPPRHDGGERRLTSVRLILPRLPPPRESERRTAKSSPLPPAPARPPVLPQVSQVPPVDAITETPALPQAATTPLPAQAPAPPTEPPRTTLRLTLPPGYAASALAGRNPALDDPRSNTPRLTFEQRIADALGGGDWVEEKTSENNVQSVGALGEHRTVLRRGNTCVELFRSRISDMDPFNGNVAPRAARMVGKSYKCR